MRIKAISISLLCMVIILLISAFTRSAPAYDPFEDAPTVNTEPCFMENTAFEVGEQITYKLYYNWNFIWLSAGEVVFTVAEDGSQYHLSAAGRTYKTYEWFFKVRDYYDTYIDKESLLPQLSIRNVHEGKYRLYDKVSFEQEKKKAVSMRGKTKEKTVRSEYNIDECMHDVLSIIYYTRNINFQGYESGQNFPIKIFMDKEVWPLKVHYKGRVPNKKIKGRGRFNTLQFSPEVIAGTVFKKGTEMNVYVSDDQNRIPLMIESPVSVGSVKAVLKNYEGLKHPMEAKIK
ncbi:MAG: DUF3108 domain-containing protein [Bacteroidota bacterium]